MDTADDIVFYSFHLPIHNLVCARYDPCLYKNYASCLCLIKNERQTSANFTAIDQIIMGRMFSQIYKTTLST